MNGLVRIGALRTSEFQRPGQALDGLGFGTGIGIASGRRDRQINRRLKAEKEKANNAYHNLNHTAPACWRRLWSPQMRVQRWLPPMGLRPGGTCER